MDSWKEIAAHLRRTVRTVQRWERQNGLPVHRHTHTKGPSIYASRNELDAWWRGYQPVTEIERQGDGTTRATGAVTLLVLPFSEAGSLPDSAYLSEGIIEELVTALGKVPRLQVPSWTSVLGLTRAGATISELVQRFRANFVVEGSVRTTDNRVRVLARLVQLDTQMVHWAESFEADVADILTLEDRLVAGVLEATGHVAPHKPTLRPHSQIPDAYALYLRSRHHWNTRTIEGMRLSVELATSALDRDPSYALAQAALAVAYVTLASYTSAPPVEAIERGRAAAMQAIEMDETVSDAHAALGYVHFGYDWDWRASEAAYQRAVALDPSSATAHQWYSVLKVVRGDFRDALRLCAEAERLDPSSPIIACNTAWMLYFMHRYVDATFRLEAITLQHPGFWRGFFNLGWCYLAQGRLQDGVRMMERASVLGRYPAATASLATAYAMANRMSDAERVIQELLTSQEHVSPYWVATAFAQIGDVSEAMRWLWRSFDDREWYLVWARHESLLDPLRGASGFDDLLRGIGV